MTIWVPVNLMDALKSTLDDPLPPPVEPVLPLSLVPVPKNSAAAIPQKVKHRFLHTASRAK